MINMVRNQIAHNAISNTRMLPFIIGIARNLCKTLITDCKTVLNMVIGVSSNHVLEEYFNMILIKKTFNQKVVN